MRQRQRHGTTHDCQKRRLRKRCPIANSVRAETIAFDDFGGLTRSEIQTSTPRLCHSIIGDYAIRDAKLHRAR
jgi:hypothetical protein